MPRISANGIAINYEQQGVGEPIVLIPYLAADHACYAFQVAEYALHSWDLAQGTGAPVDLDDSLAEAGLTAMQGGLNDETRKGAFGSEVSVADDAPAYERLAAFSGRDPRA